MKHRKKIFKFNRNSSSRRSMFRNMTNSLILHESIKTTLSKAKALQSIIDPLINTSKINTLHHKRKIFSYTREKIVLKKLINEIGPRFKSRHGGYTRILKCGFRKGDNAELAYIEIIKENG